MIVRYYKIAPDGRLANIIESESDVPVSEKDVLLGPDETMQEPPDLVEGMTPVFRGGEWVQVPSAFFDFPWDMLRPEWNGTEWVEGITVEEMKAHKLEELASWRWNEETGGLTLPDGTTIKTDRESQALLTGAAFSAALDPETPIEWKGANGWVVLMPQDVLQIAGLVRRHVQGCFSRERALSAQVDAIAQDAALSDADKVQAIRAVHW